MKRSIIVRPKTLIKKDDNESEIFGAQRASNIKSDETPDNYLNRLIKYIPAEIIAVYSLIEGILKSNKSNPNIANIYWWVFAILFIMTPIYLFKAQKVKSILHLIISSFSYAVWVSALGGPFVYLDNYDPMYPAILMPLYTFAVGFLIPNETEE